MHIWKTAMRSSSVESVWNPQLAKPGSYPIPDENCNSKQFLISKLWKYAIGLSVYSLMLCPSVCLSVVYTYTCCIVAKCAFYRKTVWRSKQEMVYGESNCHVTDDVKWPWKVKLVTPWMETKTMNGHLTQIHIQNQYTKKPESVWFRQCIRSRRPVSYNEGRPIFNTANNNYCCYSLLITI